MSRPLKKWALYASERTKVCDHPTGFTYTGTMPCTGPKVCYMCGTREEDDVILNAEKDLGEERPYHV